MLTDFITMNKITGNTHNTHTHNTHTHTHTQHTHTHTHIYTYIYTHTHTLRIYEIKRETRSEYTTPH
jgi:hypothetical protein